MRTKIKELKIWCDVVPGEFEELDCLDLNSPEFPGCYYLRVGDCYGSWHPWIILIVYPDGKITLRGHKFISSCKNLFVPNQLRRIGVDGILELEANYYDLDRDDLTVANNLASFAEYQHIETGKKCYLRYRAIQIFKQIE